jgi:hypothetical protein
MEELHPIDRQKKREEKRKKERGEGRNVALSGRERGGGERVGS